MPIQEAKLFISFIMYTFLPTINQLNVIIKLPLNCSSSDQIVILVKQTFLPLACLTLDSV